MIVRYWEPLQEASAIRHQLDRVFDELSQVATPQPTAGTPAIALVDQGDELVLTVQMPGVDADKIDVQASRETVVISGDRVQPTRDDGHKMLLDEFRYGSFRRTVNLPVAIQNERVTAEFDQGLLTLTLPKVAATRHSVVKVNVGQMRSETGSKAAETL